VGLSLAAVAAYLLRRQNVQVRYESRRRPRLRITVEPAEQPQPEAVR